MQERNLVQWIACVYQPIEKDIHKSYSFNTLAANLSIKCSQQEF